MKTVRDVWSIACPHCGDDQQIEVRMTCWRRLYPTGTDDGAAMDGYNWDDISNAWCAACGHRGYAVEFADAAVCA